MKRFRSLLLLLAIFSCMVTLFGCSGKDALVGVYERDGAKNPNSPSNRIILYKDGSCSYLGTDNATWSYKGDVVTVTTREPDSYCLDIHFDKSVQESLLRSKATHVLYILSSYSVSVIGEPECITDSYMIRVETKELLEAKNHQKLYEAFRTIDGMQTAEAYVKEGNHWDYELKVVDNCLVADSYPLDSVYVKKGN